VSGDPAVPEHDVTSRVATSNAGALFIALLAGCATTPAPATSPAVPLSVHLANPDSAFDSHSDTSFDAAARDATMIFEAHVLSRASSNVSLLPADASTVIIRVGELARTPPEMSYSTGDSVTVVLRDTTGVLPGQRAMIFAYGLIVGENIAVRELKRVPIGSTADVTAFRVRLAAADSANEDRSMTIRGTTWDALVLGTVDTVASAAVRDSARVRAGESVRFWTRAVVNVSSAFRPGNPSLVGTTISVLFPRTRSALVDRPPSLVARQRYIFWLRKTSRLPGPLRPAAGGPDAYFLLDATDQHPATDSARVVHALSVGVPMRRSSP
jgi:hypothetical protein